MGYHTIIENFRFSVYRQSDCASNSKIGILDNGEIFTFFSEHNGYLGHYEIHFLNSRGHYVRGFINSVSEFSNLAYSEKSVTENQLDSSPCYRFKLRIGLELVAHNDLDNAIESFNKGDYVYTRAATAGSEPPANMYTCGHKKESGSITPCNAFVTLDYTGALCLTRISVYIKLNINHYITGITFALL